MPHWVHSINSEHLLGHPFCSRVHQFPTRNIPDNEAIPLFVTLPARVQVHTTRRNFLLSMSRCRAVGREGQGRSQGRAYVTANRRRSRCH